MPNLREIWNFNPQNHIHWGILNNSIANFFAILLQCNFMLWYQSHSFLAGDSVVVFSVSPSMSTRNFGAQLLCPLLTVVGATLVVK